MKKTLYIILGCFSLGIGTIGAVLPLLPTVPLYLLAAFCFARSSERLHSWFTNTKIYKKNLESYAEGRGMTWGPKLRIMTSASIVMAIGFIMMKDVPVGRTVLAIIWVLHVLYFTCGIKTLKTDKENDLESHN